MNKRSIGFFILFFIFTIVPASAQRFGPPMTGPTFPTDDQVIKNIWKEAMESSQLATMAHELFDVIGPRLVGSPQMIKANNWALAHYQKWGIEARNEEYGKWRGWERGTTHIDLLKPRVRSLEGTMLAWSPATKKGGVTAGLIILADVPDSLAFQKWLPSVKGKFVLISPPQPTGRPDKDWEEFSTKESFDSTTDKDHRFVAGAREKDRLQAGYHRCGS
jgi:carboxypeptidase Q